MSSKTYFIAFCLLFYGLILSVVGMNLYIDPFYVTGIENQFNQKIVNGNERIMKRNYLLHNQGLFANVLLGSSRSTFYQFDDFKEREALFNFAVNGMTLDELVFSLSWYLKTQGQPNRVYLGVDFFQTDREYIPRSNWMIFKEDFDVLIHNFMLYLNVQNYIYYSYRMIKESIQESYFGLNRTRYYERDYLIRYSEREYPKSRSHSTYRLDYKNYNDETLDRFKEFKKIAGSAQVIAFIPPVHMDYFQNIQKQNLLPQYRRFMKELVEVFGVVYDFSGPNLVTTDKQYFFDPGHFNTKISRCVARIISDESDPSCPADFGVKVTNENMEIYLDKLEADTAAYLEAETNQSASTDKL